MDHNHGCSRGPIHSDDAQILIALLDRELLDEYAPEHMHTVEFEPFHRNGGVFVVAYDAETPIASRRD